MQNQSHSRVSRPKRRFFPALEVLESRLAPATLTWVGDMDANWNTIVQLPFGVQFTNWSGDVLPQAGDSLVFDSSAVGSRTTNNNMDLSLLAITFNDSGYT